MAFSPSQGRAPWADLPLETSLSLRIPFSLETILSRPPPVEGDAEPGVQLPERLAGAVSSAHLLVACDEDAERQVLLSEAFGPEAGEVGLCEDQTDRNGVFVVQGSAAVDGAFPFPGLEEFVRPVHHVYVAHEQHRRIPLFGKHRDGRHPVVVHPPAVQAGIAQPVFDEVRTPDDFFLPRVHGFEPHEVLDEGGQFFHGVISFMGRQGAATHPAPGRRYRGFNAGLVVRGGW